MPPEEEVVATPATGDAPAATPAADTPADTNTPPAGDTPADDSSTAAGEESPAEESGSEGDIAPGSFADFTLPEEMELQAESMASATELFKADGLNQEQAQKYVDIAAGLVQQTLEKQAGAYEQLKQDWHDQSKADPEMGGEKFDETVALAQSALEKIGTPALNALLQETGIGNHPEMIRAMRNVGALMKEDNPGGGTPPTTPKDRLSVLYPPV